jgi:conjugative relaxase-like TrwC/TraI family protein
MGWGLFAVLSMAKISVSSWRYYQNSVTVGACEYYLAAGEQPGVWVGRGLDQLGLQPDGQVTEAQLEAVFGRALHPVTATPLGRPWRVDAVTGFDLTFSAPKSVSTLWALGGKTAAVQVTAAHRAAVTAGLTYLDEHAALSRRGTDGVEQITTSGLVAGLFDHRTSRAGDPQLHTHALIPNKLLSADGVWRTVDGHEMFHHLKAAGSIYQAALRSELHSRLGIGFVAPNAHGQAEILGIPADLMTAWSKRSAQIRAEAAPTIAEYETTLGRELNRAERAKVTKTAVLKTRQAKHAAPSLAVLHQQWKTEAAALGWDAVTLHQHLTTAVTKAAATTSPRRDHTRGNGVDPDLTADAVLAAGRRRAVFSRADLTVEIAARMPVTAATADQVRVAVEDCASRAVVPGVGYQNGGRVVHLGPVVSGVTPRASDARFSSTEVIVAESRILSYADVGRRDRNGVVPPTAITAERLAGLAADQAAAVAHLTTRGDLITVLVAPAGAGKTTTIGAAARIWETAGYQVVGLAPSARAAAELGKATGGPADTLAKWLHQQQRLPELTPEQQAGWMTTAKTVLILDEASMASTFDLHTLTRIALYAGAKVVLVGDPAQIGVINGPGGMLPALVAAGHGIELSGVHRFTNDWEADASLRLRQGDTTVVSTYAEQGRLHPVHNPDLAADEVFAHWQQARAAGGEVMMLARTRDDVDQLNALAKHAAQAVGDSHGPELRVGDTVFQAGDVIVTRRNQRSIPVGDSHVRNGDRYTILTTTETGALLVQHLTGRGATLLPPAYVTEHVQHGWASTIDAAQGATTDVAILLIRPGIDREHLYVGLTRGRHENHAYIASAAVDEHGHRPAVTASAQEVLVAALARSSQQDAAHTVADRVQQQEAPAITRVSPPSWNPSPELYMPTPKPDRGRGMSR